MTEIPNPDEAYMPFKEVLTLGEAVTDCLDKGMTPDEVIEVVEETFKANAPKRIT